MGNVLFAVVKVFFRQVDQVGSFRVPDSGPVIFVANHSNQFVDPMMLMYAAKRPVRFLCAAKSMRRPLIGRLAKAANSISVERPQDLATKGAGKISIEAGMTELQGSGTAFLTQVSPGCKLLVGDTEFAVKSIGSDNTCVVAPAAASVNDSPYKVLPKVDQAETFTTVHEALKAGDCVGIFPEGGSHDRTGLLELKPGVAIMALGAMAAGSAPVQIVPCGLTYFEPHRFRSRAIVEYGQPISVPKELAALYGQDKRQAVKELMAMVEDGLSAVVPQATDYKELQALITMKALYKPRDHRLTPEESLRLTKSFTNAAKLLHRDGGDERMDKVLTLTQQYNDMLRAAGLRDRDVRRSTAGRNFTLRALGALLQVILLAPLALPALLLTVPIAIVTAILAEKERKKALAGSRVKVKAIDVVASYKILVALVIVPVYNLLIACVTTWLSGLGIWFLFVAFFLQLLLAYCLILICDHFVRCVKHCVAIVHFGCGSSSTSRLEQRRNELVVLVRELVEDLGPTIREDFEQTRVIRRSRLEQDTPLVPSPETEAHVWDVDQLLPGTGETLTAPLLQQQAA